jgi:hypothetical protein
MITERYTGARRNVLLLSDSDGQKLVGRAFQEHVAHPNWKEDRQHKNIPDMTFRFFAFDTTFRVHGSQKYLNNLYNFLIKNNFSPEKFAENVWAYTPDVIDFNNGTTVAKNRKWLDFRFEKDGGHYGIDQRINLKTYMEAFSNVVTTEEIF